LIHIAADSLLGTNDDGSAHDRDDGIDAFLLSDRLSDGPFDEQTTSSRLNESPRSPALVGVLLPVMLLPG
jgi:hypothetical protein